MSDFAAQLSEFRKREGYSRAAFADALKVNENKIKHIETGAQRADHEFLDTLRNVFKVDLNLLISGNKADGQYVPNASQFIPIPKFTVSASAGNGATAGEEMIADFYAYNKKWLTKRGLNSDNLAIISVVGNSMQPKLNDGDLILVDRSQTKVIDGKSFVVRLGDDLLVKHVQRIPDNKVALISANKDYAPINIDLKTEIDTFQVIGRVVASMQNW